jgi:hypothetical protein
VYQRRARPADRDRGRLSKRHKKKKTGWLSAAVRFSKYLRSGSVFDKH